jgi:hypothetical protein
MKHLAAALLAVAGLVAASTGASADSTSLMAGLRATLVARAAALKLVPGRASLLERKALAAAVKYIDKGPPKSLAADLAVVAKGARAFDPTFLANDPDVTIVLQTGVALVGANVAALDVREDGLLDAKLEAKADKAVLDATLRLDAAKAPTSAANTVALRLAALRDAQTIVEKAGKALDKGDACTGYGRVRLKADLVDFSPTYASATAGKNADGSLEFVFVQGYYYDTRDPSAPYHRGQIGLFFDGADFHGVGAYEIRLGATEVDFRQEATQWDFVSGTVNVTAYDETTKKMSGTFSGTATGSGGAGTTTVTDGRFRICKLVVTTE